MKKTNILGLALFATLALTAFAASSAFALKPVWLWEGAPITVALPVDMELEFALADLKVPLIGTAEILCSMIWDGTVGPGAADLIELVLDLAGKEIAELGGEGLECVNETGCPTPLFHPDGLPWDTELMELEVGVEDFDDLLLDFAFSIECMGDGASDLCLILESLLYLSNNIAAGDVEILAWLEENVGECEEGGINSTDIMLDGIGLILHANGGKLEISEE